MCLRDSMVTFAVHLVSQRHSIFSQRFIELCTLVLAERWRLVNLVGTVIMFCCDMGDLGYFPCISSFAGSPTAERKCLPPFSCNCFHTKNTPMVIEFPCKEIWNLLVISFKELMARRMLIELKSLMHRAKRILVGQKCWSVQKKKSFTC